MNARIAFGIAGIVLATGTVSAQPAAVPKPGPEEAKLAMFLGKWKSEGKAEASPWGSAGPMGGSSNAEWLPGGFFVMTRSEGHQGSTQTMGTSITGYDRQAKTYRSHYFDNAGNYSTEQCSVNGTTWTCTYDAHIGGKTVKGRGTLVYAGDEVNAKYEYSLDGSKWMPDYQIKGSRVK